ncbi:L-threonylcarbamoyladenylate synthase [Treponema sp. OMZ 840]|uniref:L-threonylcarbamoyladenylate synthase n=1 Tax=Treponema sp. OMZ 840 TaxID=244313 RepID=UPI003D935123
MILQKSDPHCMAAVAEALCGGKVVIIPTDTVYGFSGLVPASLAAIKRIKGRDEHKPFIQLIADPQDIALYSATFIPEAVRSRMPGALTVIVYTGISAYSETETTAFRCPDDDWLRSLIRLCKAPLYSTSVNRSGCPLVSDIEIMEAEFGREVFCVVDGGPQKQALASTIVDLSGGELKILRQGTVYIS